MATKMEPNITINPKDHIENIRKDKYWIGASATNPVSKDLRMAVKYLSAELYSKDVHFLMELIQNAEDNEYEKGVKPTLEFLVTCRDITKTGAAATLMIFNNEKGFSPSNIDSICAVGNSTKAGKRMKGYIGEKGIGFKSVFLLTSQPYIFSNGYQIRFSDKPCSKCDIAYIVPEWVDQNPTLSDIENIYGGPTPTTVIILPLKPDKVQSVKTQLSTIHPEMLLFLSKIRKLTVKEDNSTCSGLKPLQSVSISSEKDFVQKSSMDAESFTLHLAVDEDYSRGETECSYFMWRQKFPVKKENQVERRAEVDEWTITLAFPCGERLRKGTTTCPGIYAFLPTEMVTNLPFIIQADFLLQSSREAILFDNIWNQGILDCVPVAFVNAFTSLVKKVEGAPSSSIACMFSFLPIKQSSFTKLNAVRDSIKKRICLENIMPSEDIISNQRCFYKPSDVGRLFPSFWSILYKAKKQWVNLQGLSSLGKYVLSSAFDKDEFNDVLKFLSIGFMDYDWYYYCIRGTNLVLGVDEETYFDLLNFVASDWCHFEYSGIKKVPLLKYVGVKEDLSLFSINEVKISGGPILCCSANSRYSAWLISGSREFNPAIKTFFLPVESQKMLSTNPVVQNWLKEKLGMRTLTVYEYAHLLCTRVSFDGKLSLVFAHFLYHSCAKGFLAQSAIQSLSESMPLVNNYGSCFNATGKTVLVPAKGSTWIELLGSNPWQSYGYIELWEKYNASGTFGVKYSTPKGALVTFFKECAIASDIPRVTPPDVPLPCANKPLTKENVFLLLDWIRRLSFRGITTDSRFQHSIKVGSWMRVLMSGSASYHPPCNSFLRSPSWDTLLQKCSIMVDIPVIDEEYYDKKIAQYTDELSLIGVRSSCEDVCEFIGRHLTSLAKQSSFTKKQLSAILILMHYLRQKHMSPDKLISSVKIGRVKTTQGDRSPQCCVLYDEGWKSASLVSNIPFIDEKYYGNDIIQYKDELQHLGAVTNSNSLYEIAVKHFKCYTSLANLKPEAFIFILKCIRKGVLTSEPLIRALREAKCLKTANKDYWSPVGCFLPDAEMGPLLNVFECLPIIDKPFYGDTIFKFCAQLQKLGVFVNSADASREFLNVFKQKVNSSALTKHYVLSFLACCKSQKANESVGLIEGIIEKVSGIKWLRTRLRDYRCPASCILFGSDWESVSQFSTLPFIDDTDSGYGLGIHEYKDELKSMGVVVDIEKNHQFVIEHISLPTDMSAPDVICLLGCVRKVMPATGQQKFPTVFTEEISKKKWLKTRFGYRSPGESILFGPMWETFLKCIDGPFIDEEYYGISMVTYSRELKAIGAIVDLADATSLLADHLKLLSDSNSIKRVYHYLDHFKWKPTDEAASSHVIWVPKSGQESAHGFWVSASECVLHDGDGMFGSRVTVLEDKGYNSKLLNFFRRAFSVKSHPSTDDYCQLWKQWESSDHKPTQADCCSFWAHVVNQWDSKKSTLMRKITKVPSLSGLGGEILMVDKSKVFIPDDLLLKDLFLKASSVPLFVWTPRASHASIPQSRLLEIYRSIGVKTVSQSAVRIKSSLPTGDVSMRPTQLDNVYLRRGLFLLVLGFLSSDDLRLDPVSRHEIVKSLIKVTAYETTEPITVGYSLPVSASSQGNLNVKASRMVRWEKEKSEFYAQKLDRSSAGEKDIVEYAKNFSQVVSQGLLWKMEEHIPRLEKLLTVGFFVGFKDEAIAYYMKAENLEVFLEDEEFLSSVSSSSG